MKKGLVAAAVLLAGLLVGCGGEGTEMAQQSVRTDVGYTFVYGGVSIGTDDEARPIIERLGEPESYFEAASCVFEGVDKMYDYGSFEIDTYPLDGNEYISAIVLRDDTVSTAEGIYIGNPAEKLDEVYG